MWINKHQNPVMIRSFVSFWDGQMIHWVHLESGKNPPSYVSLSSRDMRHFIVRNLHTSISTITVFLNALISVLLLAIHQFDGLNCAFYDRTNCPNYLRHIPRSWDNNSSVTTAATTQHRTGRQELTSPTTTQQLRRNCCWKLQLFLNCCRTIVINDKKY